jgi:hypothetical protein
LTTGTSILHDLIQQDNNAASSLTSTDAMLMTPLHVRCCNPTASIESIPMLKATLLQAASMRNVMYKTPLMMLLVITSEQYSRFGVEDEDDKGELLPLVVLLK